MFKIGHGNVQLKIKTVKILRILVVAKIGSKFILSVLFRQKTVMIA